jgi:ribosomal protein L12E/L44/L45/RPP1/RPP2
MFYSRAVAARENATNNPPPSTLLSTPKPTNATPDNAKGKTVPAKKDIKKSLKGVMVKKKPKVATVPTVPATKEKRSADEELKAESDSQPETKRRRVEPNS